MSEFFRLMNGSKIIPLFFTLSYLFLKLTNALDYYVSPTVLSSGDGTLQKPFKTLSEALILGSSESVTIHISPSSPITDLSGDYKFVSETTIKSDTNGALAVVYINKEFSFIPAFKFTLSNIIFQKSKGADTLIFYYLIDVKVPGELVISNCNFQGMSDDIYMKSFVRAQGSKVSITDSNFKDASLKAENFVDLSGGSSLVLKGVTISKVYMEGRCWIFTEDGIVTIDNLLIDSSTIRAHFLLTSSQFTMVNLIITKNDFGNASFAILENSIDIANIIIKNCSFSENYQSPTSSLSFFNFDSALTNTSLSFEAILFLRNRYVGSLISISRSLGNLLLTDASFSENFAGNSLQILNSYSVSLFNVKCFRNNILNDKNNSDTGASCIALNNIWIRKIVGLDITESISFLGTVGIIIRDVEGVEALRSMIFQDSSFKQYEPAQILVSNSRFLRNKMYLAETIQILNGEGCAIYMFSSVTALFEDISFEENRILKLENSGRSTSAPALYMGSVDQSVIIKKSKFLKNKSSFFSNCIFFQGNSLILSNLEANENHPDYPWDMIRYHMTGFGGVLYFLGGSLDVSDSSFNFNINLLGGVFSFSQIDIHEQMFIKIVNCSFQDNEAHNFGACVYLHKDLVNAVFTLNNLYVKSNWADFNGGFFFAFHDSDDVIVTIADSKFFDNIADFNPAITFETPRGTGIVKNCLFRGNQADFYPKGKYFSSFFGIDKTGNLGCGGVLGVRGTIKTLLYLEKNIYENNFAAHRGGVTISVAGILTDRFSIYRNNTSLDVASIYLHLIAQLTLDNCQFLDEVSTRNGGTILLREFSKLTLIGSSFKNIYAGQKGGAIGVYEETSLTISSTSFQNITANEGVIIYAFSNQQTLISISNIIVSLSESRLGGLFYFYVCYQVLISDTLLVSNMGIIVNSVSSYINLYKSNFVRIDCSAIKVDGCLVSATTESTINITDSRIQDVTHTRSGCGGYIFSSKLILVNVNFGSMKADGKGACIFLDKSTINATGVIFTDFKVGCIFASSSRIDIDVGHFSAKLIVGQPNLYGSMIYTIESTINANDCYFEGNVNGSYGGGVINAQAKVNSAVGVLIKNSKFIFNTAVEDGGALYIKDQNTQIDNCLFMSNSAKRGGVLFLDKGSESPIVFIKNSNFSRNTATFEGGVIKYTQQKVMTISCSFVENNAPYGPIFASFPVRIHAYIESENFTSFQLVLEKIVSGGIVRQKLVFELKDEYNQTVSESQSMDDKAEIDILNQTSEEINFYKQQKIVDLRLEGIKQTKVKKGIFTFDSFSFRSNPAKSNVFLQISTHSIKQAYNLTNLRPEERLRDNNYLITINVSLRECVRGEIFDSKLSLCLQCPFGRFSLNPLDLVCTDCPPNAVCNGGDSILLNPGYWRSSLLSTNVIECSPNKDSCLGGELSLCIDGYIGPLCQSCDLKDSKNRNIRYSKSNLSDCVECGETSAILVKLFIISFFLLLFYVLLIRSNLNVKRYKTEEKKNTSTDIKLTDRTLFSIYFRMLLNYFQIVSLAQNFDLRWPQDLKNLFEIQFRIGNLSDFIFSYDCLIARGINIEPILFKAVMLGMSPYIFTVFIILFWKLMGKLRIEDNSWKITMTLLITYNYLQPSLIMTTSQIANCKEIEEGKYYMSSELSIECYTNNHYKYIYGLVCPTLALWIGIYPASTFFMLLKNRRNLRDQAISQNYGFLYNGYQDKYFFWEYVIMSRKIAIIFISIFFQSNAATKALMVLLILGVSIYLQSTRKPFLTNDLNELELRATIVSLSTIYFALFNYMTEAEMAKLIMMFIIIITNIYFLYYLFFKMLSSQIGLVKNCLKLCPPVMNVFEKAIKEYENLDKTQRGKNLSGFRKSIISLKSALNSAPPSPTKPKLTLIEEKIPQNVMNNNFVETSDDKL